MKNLNEWRNKIQEFLFSQKDIIQDKKVLDIGIGDSTNILRVMNPNIFMLDKVKRPSDKNVIYGDLTKSEELPIDTFDTIVCCEVLEHVDNPFLAVENLIKMCNNGGNIIVTVPCYLPWHPGGEYYPDYWRFMPSSLQRLFRPYETIERVYKSDVVDMPLGVCSITKVIR